MTLTKKTFVMSNIKHQLIPNTYTVLNPEDCQKWFEWANDNGISVYAGYWIGKTNLSYSVDGHLISSDYAATDMQIPADEFLLRLQNKWDHPDEVTEPDYKTKYETLLQGVKDAIDEMEAKAIKANVIGNKLRDNDYHFTSNGLSLAIKILIEKTKIQP